MVGLTTPRHEKGSLLRNGCSRERGHLARMYNRGPSARCGQDARSRESAFHGRTFTAKRVPKRDLTGLVREASHSKMESFVMKSLIPRMMTAVSIVAFALAVGGCGGGSSSTKPVAPVPTPMTVSMTMVTEDGAGYMAPDAGEFTIAAGETMTRGSVTFTCAAGGEDCMVMVAADGTVASTGGMVTAMNSMAYQTSLDNTTRITAASALDASTTALMTLAGPATTEGSARMMAMKYSMMIGTLESDGDSMAAMMNARKVLEARTMLRAARMDAEIKKAAAMQVRTGLADDDPLAMLLDGAIMRADTQIEMAMMVLEETGEGSLKSHVEMVTGTDMDNMKTPADKGEEVAMAVATALGPTTTDGNTPDGAGLRVTHGTAPPGDDVEMANRYRMNDAMGMTFAAIVGEGNLMDMRVADTGGKTRVVKAMSVDGMKTMDLFGTVPDPIATADGTEIDADVGYKGIPGLLFCAGADCMVEGAGDAQTLTGSWYVAADNPMHYYMQPADDPETADVDESLMYKQDTMYAIWGHWLTVENNGEATVTTFARAGTSDGAPADPGNWDAADPADANLSGTTATYRGMAAGRSVHKTTDANNVLTDIESGRFEADVVLTAKFAATPMLGGTIDNFRPAQGSNPGAVDPSWSVTLTEMASTGGTVTDGVADASGQDGTWTATSYGESDMRPAGIYGGFNAHFTDGHVAGAYATRE